MDLNASQNFSAVFARLPVNEPAIASAPPADELALAIYLWRLSQAFVERRIDSVRRVIGAFDQWGDGDMLLQKSLGEILWKLPVGLSKLEAEQLADGFSHLLGEKRQPGRFLHISRFQEAVDLVTEGGRLAGKISEVRGTLRNELANAGLLSSGIRDRLGSQVAQVSGSGAAHDPVPVVLENEWTSMDTFRKVLAGWLKTEIVELCCYFCFKNPSNEVNWVHFVDQWCSQPSSLCSPAGRSHRVAIGHPSISTEETEELLPAGSAFCGCLRRKRRYKVDTPQPGT